jgi:hypothetical protein
MIELIIILVSLIEEVILVNAFLGYHNFLDEPDVDKSVRNSLDLGRLEFFSPQRLDVISLRLETVDRV